MPVDGSAVLVVIICISSAAAASGLTQGYLSLSPLALQLKLRTGSDLEKKQARALLPIIERHNLLIVCLMLWNAAANEILPLFLDKLIGPVGAIIISISVVLFIGEIIPAALCTGKYQMEITYALSPMMYVVFAVFYPLAAPIAWVLDHTLGEGEGVTTFSKMELSALMKIQEEEAAKKRGPMAQSRSNRQHASIRKKSSRDSSSKQNPDESKGESNDEDIEPEADAEGDNGEDFKGVREVEVGLIDGVLKFGDRTAKDIMNSDVFMLSIDVKLNQKTLQSIFTAGYGRFLVYENDRSNIKAVVVTKDLLAVEPDDEVPLRTFCGLFGKPVVNVSEMTHLDKVLLMFQNDGGHIVAVREDGPESQLLGIVTVEDIFAQIMGKSISKSIVNKDGGKKKDRDADVTRMSMLHRMLHGPNDKLTPDEIKAVTAFLQSNVPQLKQLIGDDLPTLRRLVAHSTVVEVLRKATDPEVLDPADRLFTHGEVANVAILVLSGTVKVLAGKDQFQVELGQWTILAKDVFSKEENTYVADFSAYVASPTVRYLKITKPGTATSEDSKVKVKSAWQNLTGQAKKSKAEPGFYALLRNLQKNNAAEFGEPEPRIGGLKAKVPVSFLKQAILMAAAEQKATDDAKEQKAVDEFGVAGDDKVDSDRESNVDDKEHGSMFDDRHSDEGDDVMA